MNVIPGMNALKLKVDMVNKISTSESKFVGVWLSRQINSFLSLYALSKKVTKSEVIRNEMESWAQENSKAYPTQDLIANLVLHCQQEWKDKKFLHRHVSVDRIEVMFEIYKDELVIHLTNKGLSETWIKRVIEGLIQ